MGIFKAAARPTSKMRKQARMHDRIENAPPPAPKRGTVEWKKARNQRRRDRLRAVQKIDKFNQARSRA